MKIKLNWGVGIVLAFLGFIGFIMFFIVRMSTDKKFEHDLVTEEYYKEELAFQDEIDAQENSAALVHNILVNKTAKEIKIQFPADKKDIEGTIFFYRPSNKKLDVTIPISLSYSTLTVPLDQLVEGNYKLFVNWKSEGVSYLFKKDIKI